MSMRKTPVGDAVRAAPPAAAAESACDDAIQAQLFAAARAIKNGQVMSYGALGALCQPPISGYICGRMLRGAPDDVPWWRVVARDGRLPIGDRNLGLAVRQRALLESEGVQFDDEARVLISRHAPPQR